MIKFRYPVGNGSREDFELRYYNAQGFGNKTSYGYHEGIDLNLKTGGDSDMGDNLYAIWNWQLKYYHLKSHLESGYGIHFVYQVDSPFGRRWIHYAHCQDVNFNPNQNPSGLVGSKLATIGASGRPRGTMSAHLHMAVFKVDPVNLPNGIDTIANNQVNLNKWWEDPTKFMNDWYNHSMAIQPTDDIKIEDVINDGYKALCDANASESDMKWRLESWKDTENFIKSLAGDSRFYDIYVKPAVEKEKKAIEDAHTTALSEKDTEWQTEMATAKNKHKEAIKALEIKKFKDYKWHELVKYGFIKMLGGDNDE